MAKAAMYKITIIGWEKHNPKLKKGFAYFMFHSGFFQDSKICQLTQIETLTYINLMCIACESASNRITITPQSMPKSIMIGPQRLHNALLRFEELQLVTVDEMPSLRTKGIELNELKELNTRKIKNVVPTAAPSAPAPTKSESQKSAYLIAKYCEAWKSFHGSNPPIVGKDAGIAKRLAKNWTEETIDRYITAFFQMPDAFVVKAKHPLEFFEMKLKEIAAFAESGSFVTRKQATQFDDHATNAVLLEKVKRGAI